MSRASALKVNVTAKGLDGILELKNEIDLVFDATSAEDHIRHAPLLKKAGIVVVDLTPAKVGLMCVPAVNLEACLGEANVNMVTCGGQAAIPLAYAIAQANPQVEYIETVSSIASRSAGPATRINLDEYLCATETGLSVFTGCDRAKAIINLNPAQPCVHMQTTVMAKICNPDLVNTRDKIMELVTVVKKYVPGYNLIIEPMIEAGRLIVMVRVDGLGDYLPKYAGNLDIINCAAVAFAEAYSRRRNN
jgi:acetaldehyde dehydrogenase